MFMWKKPESFVRSSLRIITVRSRWFCRSVPMPGFPKKRRCGGMKRGGICGAVSGGVMALGLFGIDDPARLGRFYKAFLEKQNGLLECADLVRAVTSKGLPKKPHCDAMVLFAVQTVETILKEEGKLPSREE